MSQDIIRYGDTISVCGILPNPHDQTKQRQGVLISKGFTEVDLFFAYNNLDNTSRQELFKLLPKSSFEIHDEMTNPDDDPDYESRREKEIQQFVNNNKLMEGGDVHFGQSVILKHVLSGGYLRGCFVCGQAGFGSFKLELTQQFSSDILFRVETYRSFQKEGQKFRYKTPFKLHHLRSNSYLNYIEKEIFLAKSYQDIHPIIDIRQPTRYPTVNQSKSQLILWMQPHFRLEEHKVQHQDIVYLQYSKGMGYLACDVLQNKIFIKQLEPGTVCYDALWQLFQSQDEMYLRHYIYKKDLTVDSYNNIQLADTTQNRLVLTAVVPKPSGIHNKDLVNLKHNHNILAEGPKIQKVFLNKLIEYCQRNQRYKSVYMCQQSAAEDSFKLVKLEHDEREPIDFLLSSTQLLVKLRCFLEGGTDKRTIQDYLIKNYNQFLQESVKNTLQKLIGRLYECSFSQINTTRNKHSRTVSLMMRDVGLVDILVDIVEVFGRVYPNLQGFDQFSGKGNEINNLIRVFELSYLSLQHLCQQREVKLYTSQYLKLFLEHFYIIKEPFVQSFLWRLFQNNHIALVNQISHQDIAEAVTSFISCHSVQSAYIKLIRFFCSCGKESIRSNQDRVRSLFFAQNKFVVKFRMEADKIVIVFLGEQLSLMDYFTKYKATQTWKYTYQYLMLLADMSVHQNSESIKYISNNIISYETICALLNSVELKDIEKQCILKYYRRLINPLIRVVHYCYIDVPGFETIRRIAKVRQWKDIDKKNVILKSHSTKKKNQLVFINKVLDFIVQYLRKVETLKQFQSSRALLSLLQLLRSTITLGFWEDIEQFRQLLPLLIDIVKYDSKSVVKAVEEATKGKMVTKSQMQDILTQKKIQINSQTNRQYLDCKIKCLDIIDIMMDMETNTRVSLLTFFFKGLYWYSIDFQRYLKPIQLEFSSQQSHRSDDHLMGTIMRELKHRKEPDMFDNYNLWINKMRELTPIQKEEVETKVKRYLFNRFKHIKQVFLSLMELSQYRDYQLMNFGLLILSRIFGQRKDLINNFENVIIVAEGNFNKLSKKSRQEIRSKLKFLEIPNIRELTKQKDEKEAIRIWKPYAADEQVEEKKKSGIVQDLCYLIEMMKEGRSVDDNSLKNLYKYDSLGSNLTIYHEKDYPNALYQKLIKNQDSHLVLLKYIALIDNPDSNEIHVKCLHAIYNYLTMLIWNHPKNKADLTHVMKLVTKHLAWNIGVADFIRQLFKNNRNLVKSDVTWIIEMLLDQVRQKSSSDYYRSKLLDIFRLITIFNDKGVKKNQLDILSAFQRTKFQVIDLKNLTHQLRNYKQSLGKLMNDSPDERLNEYFQRNKLKMSPQLTFTTFYFQVFSCLIESRHEVNIGKCSNIHPYLDLLTLVEQSQGCWPLLRHLRGYVNRLYYIPVQYDILLFEQFIKRQLNNLATELKNYIEDFEQDYERHSLIEFEQPIRFTFLASYTYCAFIEILTSFYSMVSKPKFIDHLKYCMRTNSKILDQVLSLMELFGYIHLRIIRRKSKSKFLICFLRQIKGCLLTFLDTVSLKHMQQRYDKKQFSHEEGEPQLEYVSAQFFYDYSRTFFRNFIEMITCHKIEKAREALITKLKIKNEDMNVDEFTKKIKYVDLMFTRVIKRFEKYKLKPVVKLVQQTNNQDQIKIITHHSRSFNVLGKQELTHDQQNAVLNDIQEKICQNMQTQDIYSDYKGNEFMMFVKLFFDFDSIQKEYYGGLWKSVGMQESIPIITIKDFVMSVIEMIKTSPDSIKNDSKIQFVRILRLYISETVEQGKQKLPVDKWTADYIQDEESKLKLAKSQQLLIQANCHQLIFSIFKQRLTNNIVLLNQLLLLTIALLFGGNRVCQDALLSQMMKDKDNLMLNQIELTIRFLGDQLYYITKIRETISSPNNFHMTHEDTYDYFNAKERLMERKFIYQYDPIAQKVSKRQKSNALNRIFRFLQLLCENNNVEMKKFIRLQIDESGHERSNSINFIEKTTLLLRRFFKIMNGNILTIPLFLMDFVNEVTQLPCVDNQVTFCKSTFLQDLCFMQTFMTKEKRLTMLIESDEDVQQLFSIYNKSISLVLSNMEGNQDTIFQQIRSKLTMSFLASLTAYNFKKTLEQFNIQFDNNSPITDETVCKLQLIIQKSQLPQSYLNLLNILSVLYKQNDRRKEGEQDRLAHFLEIFPALLPLTKEILRIQINLYTRQYIYFPRYPLFGCLSKQTKKEIMQSVDRDTQRDKLNGLIGYADEVIEEMQMFQNITTSKYDNWYWAALYLSYFIQLLLLILVSIDMGPQHIDFYYRRSIWWYIIKALSLVQLGCSFLYLIEWLRVRSDLAVKKHNRKCRTTIENEVGYFGRKFDYLVNIWTVLISLIHHERQFFNIFKFILSSCLGMFLGAHFYALHLFESFTRIAIMKSVFEAVIFNAKQLLTVSLLGIFFIYAFNLVSMSFNILALPQKKTHCDSVLDCVLTIYVSGTISQEMQQFEFSKFLASLIYIVVMQLLFSNIVSGIMIDTFAELRDRKKQIIEDMKNLCFICGMSRSQADKKNKDFDQHIKTEHYLWNYIFYIYCLRNKDNTDYTGIEYSIAEKLQKEDLSWIPIEKDDDQEEREEPIHPKLQEIKMKLRLLLR